MKLNLRYLLVSGAASIFTLLAAQRAEALEYDINFDLNWSIVANFAKDTVAVPTRFREDRSFVPCDAPLPNTDTGTCWVHKHPGGPGKAFTTFPQAWGHFHAQFSDASINCYNVKAGGFGRKPTPSSPCTAADWKNEPRHLTSHVADHWMELAYKDYTGGYHPFSLKKIAVGNQPIQLWYQTANGVFGWSTIGANAYWEVNTGPTTIVWVSGAASATSAYTIYNWTAEPL